MPSIDERNPIIEPARIDFGFVGDIEKINDTYK